MKQSAERHAPTQTIDTETRVQKQNAGDDAQIVKHGTKRIDEKFSKQVDKDEEYLGE